MVKTKNVIVWFGHELKVPDGYADDEIGSIIAERVIWSRKPKFVRVTNMRNKDIIKKSPMESLVGY